MPGVGGTCEDRTVLDTTTARLDLRSLTLDDVDALYAVYSDPGTWLHQPEGRFTSRERARRLIVRSLRSVRATGLGEWAVRVGAGGATAGLPAGTFIGAGGVKLSAAGVWNLGYRLTPASWGRGFATEVARAALEGAAWAAPDRPVTARVLANNPASVRVIERVGLELVWEGRPAASGAPQDGDERPLRRVYTDRPLTPDAYRWLVRHA